MKGPVRSVKVFERKYKHIDRDGKSSRISEKEFKAVENEPDKAERRNIRVSEKMEYHRTYDTSGFLVKEYNSHITDFRGYITVNIYDGNHNRVKQIRYYDRNDTVPREISLWRYDPLGNVEEVVVESKTNGKKITRNYYDEKKNLLKELVLNEKLEAIEKKEYFYNKDGKLIKKIDGGAYNTYKYIYIYIYDENGFRTGLVNFGKDGEFSNKTVYTRDSIKNIEAKLQYYSSGDLWSFDSTFFNAKKQLIRQVKNSKNSEYRTEDIEYDAIGRKITVNSFSKRPEDSAATIARSAFHPATGKRASMMFSKGNKKTIILNDIYGNRLSTKTEINGIITEETKYLLTYDRYGNLIKDVEIKNGEVSSVRETEIKYYEP